MIAQLGFKIGKVTIKGIGGIGDLEAWMIQTSEEPGQIALEAEKGAAQARVRVAWTPAGDGD